MKKITPVAKYALWYLALIVFFAIVYAMLPDEAWNKKEAVYRWFDALYFSIVTITTLGFGDICPQSVVAKILVSSQVVMGVVIIGFFLNAVSQSISTRATEEEKAKAAQQAKDHERKRLITMCKILTPSYDDFMLSIYCLTTPIEKRDFKDWKVNKVFSVNDLQDMYQLTLLVGQKLQMPAIEYYFKKLDNLLISVLSVIQNIDLTYWPELEENLTTFVRKVYEADVKGALLGYSKQFLVEGKRLSDLCTELIRKYNGEDHLKTVTILTPVVILCNLLQMQMQLREEYDKIIRRITRE